MNDGTICQHKKAASKHDSSQRSLHSSQSTRTLASDMITLYSHTTGPNGWKVAIVLEELGIPYETKFLSFDKGEHKAAEHTALNPNGRIPTIVDHGNNDFALWESVAIIKYLVDRYDKDNKISFTPGSDDDHRLNQWLAFQASGQGPYFGQMAHFVYRHPVQVPTAVARYRDEIERVISVLDSVLAKQPYLVGDRVTAADLALIPWNNGLVFLLAKDEGKADLTKYVHYQKWHKELNERAAVKKVMEHRASVQA